MKDLNKVEATFWLYVTLREEILPVGYFNMMIEAAIVTGEVFNFLFKSIDPISYDILGNIPGTVF